jgi:anti-sigma factor RsiW
MTNEDRLRRALAAPAAPAKDMHFTLQVMRRAEAERFRAETAQRLLRGAALAGLAAVGGLAAANWVAANADFVLDGALIAGAMAALALAARGFRPARPAPR